MNLLIKYCPTYTRLCVWLWNSPTFTTWGNYGAQSLRLLLVTPLILTRFDETEIAAWYLFASLNFFGTTISQRLGLTFSRMFSFAMGGASNLAPIKGKREQENEGNPNWTAFERAYGTVGSLNFGIAWLNVLMALGMGWFGLSNLLQGYEGKGIVWLAFALMQMSALLSFIFQRYGIALRGMNYVALSNRWGILFSLLSIAAGSLTLWLDGGIIALVLVMQFFSIVSVFRSRFLLHAVEGGRVLRFRQYGFDREVFSWAWEPTWKGFVAQFGTIGGVQIASIIYIGIGTKADAASYLFAVRILATVTEIAQAPITSVHPQLSKLRASDDISSLRRLIRERIWYSLILLITGVILAGVLLPLLLELIGSNIAFIPTDCWLIMGGLAIVLRYDMMCASTTGIGNQVTFFWQPAVSALIGSLILVVINNKLGIYGPILISFLPLICMLNFQPIRLRASILNERGIYKWGGDLAVVTSVYVTSSAVLMFFIN